MFAKSQYPFIVQVWQVWFIVLLPSDLRSQSWDLTCGRAAQAPLFISRSGPAGGGLCPHWGPRPFMAREMHPGPPDASCVQFLLTAAAWTVASSLPHTLQLPSAFPRAEKTSQAPEYWFLCQHTRLLFPSVLETSGWRILFALFCCSGWL